MARVESQPVPEGRERKNVPLDVTYRDGAPQKIEYSHAVYGLVRFTVENDVAVINEEWDQIKHSSLKDGYTPAVYTEDIVHSVKQLPFISEVEA